MKLPAATAKLLLRFYLGASRTDSDGMPIQTAALPWRTGRGKRTEVLLVTGRNSGRWSLPKGWPMRGKTLAKAAAQEAFEEAGVEGVVESKPLGSFVHTKQHRVMQPLEVRVLVHALSVSRELASWPECGQRERKWFSLDEAATSVSSRELRALILSFGKTLGGSKT